MKQRKAKWLAALAAGALLLCSCGSATVTENNEPLSDEDTTSIM